MSCGARNEPIGSERRAVSPLDSHVARIAGRRILGGPSEWSEAWAGGSPNLRSTGRSWKRCKCPMLESARREPKGTDRVHAHQPVPVRRHGPWREGTHPVAHHAARSCQGDESRERTARTATGWPRRRGSRHATRSRNRRRHRENAREAIDEGTPIDAIREQLKARDQERNRLRTKLADIHPSTHRSATNHTATAEGARERWGSFSSS